MPSIFRPRRPNGGDALYVVNARFADAAPLTAGTPDIDYAILRVPRR